MNWGRSEVTRLIAGDIGGTKTTLQLVEVAEGKATLNTLYQASYPSQEFRDLVPIVQQFFVEAKQELSERYLPETACFAIAGLVVNQTSHSTNLSWFLDAQRLERELEMSSVSLINDFAAVSYGVLGLEASDLETLQAGQIQGNAPIGIIGAGTGLGEGFLVPQASGYEVFTTEGGHTDFAPRSEREFQLLEYLQNKLNLNHVSVERVVSGQGIVAIYQFLRDRAFASESPQVAEVVRRWEQQPEHSEKKKDPAATISQAAWEESDRLSEMTMQMFIEAYAAESGNLALKLLPYGGLYIAGGIAPKNLPLIQKSSFLEVFKQKGRLSPALEGVPIHVVLNTQVGLLGSVRYALGN